MALSKEEFEKLARRDVQAAWKDIAATTEDYGLRVWKIVLLTQGHLHPVAGNGKKNDQRGVEELEL